MSTATRSPLTEQAEKLQNLARHLSDGRLLEPVLRMAQSGDVWSGAIHDGFLNWMQFALDGWVRNQLAQGIRLVAESLANRAAEIDRVAQAMVNSGGAIPMAQPAPPAPLNYSPGRPPQYGDIGGGSSNNKFNHERMKELARLLESTADGPVIEFARSLRSALEPPPSPPPTPGAPPATNPVPPDSAIAAGDPGSSSPGANAYLALADELHKAADDIERRVRQLSVLAEPLPTATVDSKLFDDIGAGATAGVESSTQAGSGTFIGPPAPARSPEELEKARYDGAAAGHDVGKIVGAKRWDDEDHEKLFLALSEAEKHVDDPDYAVAFMKGLVPDGLASWCKLMNNSVIDLQIEMDILRPMSRLFATATHQGEQFPPETRSALMNSRCLDTLVHYGNFETEFAADAARKILKNPDYYERSDKSDRVYMQLDDRRKWHEGDARLGALKMLANNPAAATEILESYGEEGRRLIFKALEDDDLVGKEAATVLERGLADFPSRKLSEDTLELIIKDSAEGRLDLSDHGKRAMARLLTTEEGMKRLLKVSEANVEAWDQSKTSDEGFWVSAGTFKEFAGKLLDDEGARAEFLKGLAAQNAVRMKQEAAALGAEPIGEDIRKSMSRLGDTIKSFPQLNQLTADGVKDASNEKEANAFKTAGINLVIGEAIKLVPGGYVGKFVVDKALETAGSELTDKVLSAEEKKRVKTLDEKGLTNEMDRATHYLALVAVFGDKELTAQLVPPGSPLRQWDKDGDGRIQMPTPPLAGTKTPKDWQAFTEALKHERDNNTPIGQAVREIETWAEIWKSET
jgi:hypothetical protein